MRFSVQSKDRHGSPPVAHHRHELGFLIASLTSALLFFAASALAFRSLSYDEFGGLSAALAIGTFIAAGTQIGAGYELPRLARNQPQSVSSAYLGFLAGSLTVGGLVAAVGYHVTATSTVQRWALLFAMVTGAQLVSDGYLRARGALTTLWRLNLGLNGALLLVTVGSLTSGSLNAVRFLISVIAIKAAFATVVLSLSLATKPARPRIGPLRQGVTNGTTIVITVFGLGMLDVLTLGVTGISAGTYLSARHFGYGIFLALVQEGILPILVRRLAAHQQLDRRMIGLASVGVSSLVGVGAVSVAVVLAWVKQDLTAEYVQAAVLVGVGLLMHTNAVFALKVGYVCNRLPLSRVGCYAVTAVVAMSAAAVSGGIVAVSIVWAAVNAGIALAQHRENFLQNSRQLTSPPLPTTTMPPSLTVNRSRSDSASTPSCAPLFTSAFLSMIAPRTTAPGPIDESSIMIESSTTAPDAIRTPGDNTEL